MKKVLSYTIIVGLFIFTFFTITAHPFRSTSSPQAIAGYLNLAEWNFAEEGTFKLSGEWEVYDGQLLTPEHFSKFDSARNAEKAAEKQAAEQAVDQIPQLSGYFDPTAARSLKDMIGIGSVNDWSSICVCICHYLF